MKRWVQGVLGIVFVLGIVGLSAVPAYSVAGNFKVGVVGKDGRTPSPGARVTINLQDGSKEEGRTDRAGVVIFGNSGGDGENDKRTLPITSIEVEPGDGSVYSFNDPLRNSSSSEEVFLNLAFASSVAAASGTGGVSVTRSYGGSEDHPIFKFSVTGGYTFGSIETSLSRGSGSTNKGKDIDIGQFSVRPDVRVYLGPLLHWGNVGNVGTMGRVGNIGNVGEFGLFDCYAGVQGAIGVSGGDEGLERDEHPGTPDGEVDTRISQQFKGSITPYLGCKIADFQQYGYFNLQAGPRISFWDYAFTTDETSGGGELERFESSETKVGAAFGLEFNKHFSYGNLGNLGLGDSVYGGLQIGIWGEYLPGETIRETTNTFSIDYTAKTKGAWLGTVRVGWGLYF